LALRYHPDRNSDPKAAEMFKTLVTAYEILSNADLKASYDSRLQNGFAFEATPIAPLETEREIKLKWYAKRKIEEDALIEVENLAAYEKSLKIIPSLWRFLLIGMMLLWSVLLILDDWFKKGSYIALGAFIFMIFSFLFWNELYKYYWYKSLMSKEEKPTVSKYDTMAYSIFLKVFFAGLILLFAMIKVKKAWHLHFFGEVITARNEKWSSHISYWYDKRYYTSHVYSIPEKYRYKTEVFIRVSSKEPEIWEFEAGD